MRPPLEVVAPGPCKALGRIVMNWNWRRRLWWSLRYLTPEPWLWMRDARSLGSLDPIWLDPISWCEEWVLAWASFWRVMKFVMTYRGIEQVSA